MAKETNVVSPIDSVLIEKTDWYDAASVRRYFTQIGGTMSAAQVWANIAMGYFHLGETAKATNSANGTNTPPDISGPFNAYRAAAQKRKGKDWTESTTTTYASVAKTLADIAYGLPYEGATLAKYFAEKGGSVSYGSRAAMFKQIADHFTTEPTAEEIEAFAKTLAGDDATLSDDLVSIERAIEKALTVDHGDVVTGDSDLEDAALELQDAFKAFKARAAVVSPASPAKGRGKAKTEAALKLEAKRAAREAERASA